MSYDLAIIGLLLGSIGLSVFLWITLTDVQALSELLSKRVSSTNDLLHTLCERLRVIDENTMQTKDFISNIEERTDPIGEHIRAMIDGYGDYVNTKRELMEYVNEERKKEKENEES